MQIVVRNLAEQIFDVVRDRIIAGSVPDRGAIRQDALASELGVSKIPLREALAAVDDATRNNLSSVGRFNRAFHLALVSPGRQPLTLQMVERLHVMAERYVRKHLEPGGREQRAALEHAALFDAWVAGDGAGVRRLTQDHIAATLADLRAQLRKQ